MKHLEPVYLMNVILYLDSISTATKLLYVSHSTQSAIARLKTNPTFPNTSIISLSTIFNYFPGLEQLSYPYSSLHYQLTPQLFNKFETYESQNKNEMTSIPSTPKKIFLKMRTLSIDVGVFLSENSVVTSNNFPRLEQLKLFVPKNFGLPDYQLGIAAKKFESLLQCRLLQKIYIVVATLDDFELFVQLTLLGGLERRRVVFDFPDFVDSPLMQKFPENWAVVTSVLNQNIFSSNNRVIFRNKDPKNMIRFSVNGLFNKEINVLNTIPTIKVLSLGLFKKCKLESNVVDLTSFVFLVKLELTAKVGYPVEKVLLPPNLESFKLIGCVNEIDFSTNKVNSIEVDGHISYIKINECVNSISYTYSNMYNRSDNTCTITVDKKIDVLELKPVDRVSINDKLNLIFKGEEISNIRIPSMRFFEAIVNVKMDVKNRIKRLEICQGDYWNVHLNVDIVTKKINPMDFILEFNETCFHNNFDIKGCDIENITLINKNPFIPYNSTIYGIDLPKTLKTLKLINYSKEVDKIRYLWLMNSKDIKPSFLSQFFHTKKPLKDTTN
ncbi:hypothetical protein EIN_355580 [Entamoeba invadens IP1]|uniref:Uncharacterized protein n=1 Tax=Entamoeba invadens IP1 TaxID=370355 RepID=L7FN79_ENTIV|nr:hypothetical protein EIN_355580 [Entamoeba invadens IP1]ELP92537.1 hypothetical protein EIN_355580 [Entamoeba invadens IP1]|eukprot:XP_004259308.1 hypothetical protein EIN_355580 [Entamoeba invadens IP1]